MFEALTTTADRDQVSMAFGYERGDPNSRRKPHYYYYTVIPYLAPAPAPEIKVGTVLRTVYCTT